jgi:signal transduction histidine kinase
MSEVVVYFNTEIDTILFVVSRLILTINMIFYLKYRHNVERFNLIQRNLQFEKVNNQLIDANQELLSQNKEVSRQKKKIDQQNAKLRKIRLELEESNNSLEERILARTEELISVNEKLKKTLADLDRFVYSASHDLSAPLKSILGLVQIAKLENKDKLLNEHLNHIEKSINKQEIVINSLIQFSRNNRNETRVTAVDLDVLVDDMISDLKYYPGFNTVDIKKDLSVRKVVCDEGRLRMILNNLLSNGIKYQDSDKKDRFIRISSKANTEFWSLTVSDNGQGIGEDETGNIFKMFYRANEFSDGSGLGLFIVAEAIEKLNGSIKVESKLKEGSTFILNFPMKVD